MRILIGIFMIIWMSIVMIDYSNKHPIHFIAIEQMKLWGFILSVLGLTGILIFLNEKFLKPGKIPKRFVNGSLILGLSIFIGLCSCFFYTGLIGLNPNIKLLFVPVLHSILNFGALLLFLFSMVCMGKILSRKFSDQLLESSQKILWTGIGLMALSVLMFILGVFHILNTISLGIVILIPIILERAFALKWMKELFIDSLLKDKILENKLIALCVVLISFLVINFIYIQIPFPPGFDSRNYYLNISQLINQQNGLVKGFQPYNWSLIMSYGFVLFKNPAIAFGISFLGGVLSIWALVEIAVNYLKLSLFQALFVATIFLVTPSVANQLFVELKVDLGLLFMQLLSVILLMNIYFNDKKLSSKANLSLIVLLGLISGFCLGIKLTHIYLIFAIMAFIWFKEHSIKGFFAIFSLILFIVFITRLDNLSGLSKYHLGVSYYKWAFLAFSLILAFYIFKLNANGFLQTIKTSAIISIFTVVLFAPWMVKNFTEAGGNLTIEKLLLGSNPGPDVNLKTIEINFNKSLNQDK